MSKVYQIVTDRVVAMIENGSELPWQRPWKGMNEMPRNFVSGKTYRGINVFNLAFTNWASPLWITRNQVQKLGGCVRPDQMSKGELVVFWKLNKYKKKNEEKEQSFPFLRYYLVFNVEQCIIPEKELIKRVKEPGEKLEFDPIEQCEALVEGFVDKPLIKHMENRAYYSPVLDIVNMPKKENFHSVPEYYSVLFHELTHSTGHKSRLNRKSLEDQLIAYSKEELIAEMGATFLCAIAGIENKTIDNSAAYISCWLSKLKSDPRLIVQAAASAQKAVDYMQGVTWEKKVEVKA